MKINGREFSFQIASDIVRNGIGVELLEHKDGKKVYLAELFRNDSKKEIEFNSIELELPYKVLVQLQEAFESEIPKSFDE